jgi:hypothetical protein
MDEDGGERGALLYGYGRDQARKIKGFLEAFAGRDVAVYGGRGREANVISEIIGGEPDLNFEFDDTRMLMFLGFDDGEIGAILNSFPRDGGIPRPIFCTPTENNINWTLSMLLEHLLEEQRYWAEKERGGK